MIIPQFVVQNVWISKKDCLSLKLNAFGPSWLMQQIKFSKSIIFSLGPRKKSGTKDGKIFIPSFRNLHFSGDPTILQQTYKKKLKNSNLTYEIFECEPIYGNCSTIAFSTRFPLASFIYTDHWQVLMLDPSS